MKPDSKLTKTIFSDSLQLAIEAHFSVVERSHGPALLHNSLPVYIVEYEEFPEQQQPRHWHVYYASSPKDREPWTSANRKLNFRRHGYLDSTEAVEAAMKMVSEFNGVRQVVH